MSRFRIGAEWAKVAVFSSVPLGLMIFAKGTEFLPRLMEEVRAG
jgi:hypothetical protein